MVQFPWNTWTRGCLFVLLAACIFLAFPIGIFSIVIMTPFTPYFSVGFLGAILILAALLAAGYIILVIWLRRGQK